MKFVCVLFIILSMNFDFVMPVDLQCYYEYDSWSVVGTVYQCKVQNNLNIISTESAVISGAIGSHKDRENNDDVHGFYAENKKIEIFPRGLEKIYKNLKLIIIGFGRIKEIHQSDLKTFSQLEYLNLNGNDIQVLEEGLFDFNPKLAYISFNSNKISKIHPNVFDHLTKLNYLWLRGNQCVDKFVQDNSEKVKELIKEVKRQCPNHFTYKEVQKLKLNFNDLNLKFKDKLTKVEETCQNSFLNVNPKISKLEATSNELLTNFEILKNSLSTSSSKNAKDLQAINLKIQETENENQNMKQNMHKFEKLENAVKANEQNLQTLKSEMFAAFGKILEKLEENTAKIEQRTAPKMAAIMKNLKSQNQQISTFNEKMKNLEAGLATLQSELFDGKNTAQSSCGLDLDENEDQV